MRRAFSQKVEPGVWTTALHGHPSPGELPEDAARRRALRVLGLRLDDVLTVLPAVPPPPALAAGASVTSMLVGRVRQRVVVPRPHPVRRGGVGALARPRRVGARRLPAPGRRGAPSRCSGSTPSACPGPPGPPGPLRGREQRLVAGHVDDRRRGAGEVVVQGDERVGLQPGERAGTRPRRCRPSPARRRSSTPRPAAPCRPAAGSAARGRGRGGRGRRRATARQRAPRSTARPAAASAAASARPAGARAPAPARSRAAARRPARSRTWSPGTPSTAHPACAVAAS